MKTAILCSRSFTRLRRAACARLALWAASLATALSLQAQPGSVDLTFDPGELGVNGTVYALLVQGDGKILIGGSFSGVNGTPRSCIARLESDGSLDTNFVPAAVSYGVNALALQPDGKVIIGGSFGQVGGLTLPRLARLNADGSLDPAFAPAWTTLVSFYSVNAVAVQSDGAILYGGDDPRQPSLLLDRLHADGTHDSSFYDLVFQPDGGVANLDGSTYAITVLPNDQILCGGDWGLYKAHADGSWDGSFASVTFNAGNLALDTVRAIAALPDGKWLIGGSFTNINGVTRGGLARLNRDGSLDTAFDPGLNGTVVALAVQCDGKIIVSRGTSGSLIDRLNPDGTLDSGFEPVSVATGRPIAVAVQNCCHLIVGGSFTNIAGIPRRRIARLNADSPSAPAIVTPPASQTVAAGRDVSFTVAVTCPPSPAYQWRLNDVGLIGATNATLTLRNVQWSDAGNYTVVVTNTLGSVTSAVAVLTITAAPVNPGSVDVAFWPNTGANNTVFATAEQADGKVLIGGSFTRVNGVPRNCIARLNPDGSLDASFDPGAGVAGITTSTPAVRAIAVQPDGKVLIGGCFSSVNGVNRSLFARLNADGSLDESYLPDLGLDSSASATAYAVALQPDGKVLIGGDLKLIYNSASRGYLARFNPDGSCDMTFQTSLMGRIVDGIRAIAVQRDGKVVIGGNSGSFPFLVRLKPNGSDDPDFYQSYYYTQDSIYSLAVQADGRIVFGSGRGVARLLPDGHPDTTFSATNPYPTRVYALALQPCGQVVIGGSFTNMNGVARKRIARLQEDGSLDASFDPGGAPDGAVYALLMRRDGKILAGGDFATANGVPRNGVVRLNNDPADPPSITLQPVDQTIAAGRSVAFSVAAGCSPTSYQWQFNGTNISQATNATLSLSAVRSAGAGAYTVIVSNGFLGVTSSVATLTITPAPTGPGAPDIESVPAAVSAPTNAVQALALQPDGKLVAGFAGPGPNVVRFNRDGSMDSGFVGALTNNSVWALAVQRDGKILAGASTIVRLWPDGSRDLSYMFSPCCGIKALALQPDGGGFLGGSFSAGSYYNFLKLGPDGVPDMSFDPGMGPNGEVRALALQSDGRVILGGAFTQFDHTVRGNLARALANGHLDTSFNQSFIDRPVNAVAVQADGKVVIGGEFTMIQTPPVPGRLQRALARLNPNGRVDETFNPSFGTNSIVRAIVLQPDGRLLVGGTFTTVGFFARNGIVRLNPDGSVDPTFDPGNAVAVTGTNAPTVYALALEPGGGVWAGGSFSEFDGCTRANLARLYGNPALLEPSLSSTVFNAALPTDLGRTYFLEFKNSLNESNWSPLLSLPGDGTVKSLADPEANPPQRFYRVRVE